jgi:hypothetical protein
MNYILIVIIGLLFLFINYLIITKRDNTNNHINNNQNTININGNEQFRNLEDDNNVKFQNLAVDVRNELEEMYNIANSDILMKHNENSKKYELIDI